jgi:hypothetical protein
MILAPLLDLPGTRRLNPHMLPKLGPSIFATVAAAFMPFPGPLIPALLAIPVLFRREAVLGSQSSIREPRLGKVGIVRHHQFLNSAHLLVDELAQLGGFWVRMRQS